MYGNLALDKSVAIEFGEAASMYGGTEVFAVDCTNGFYKFPNHDGSTYDNRYTLATEEYVDAMT